MITLQRPAFVAPNHHAQQHQAEDGPRWINVSNTAFTRASVTQHISKAGAAAVPGNDRRRTARQVDGLPSSRRPFSNATDRARIAASIGQMPANCLARTQTKMPQESNRAHYRYLNLAYHFHVAKFLPSRPLHRIMYKRVLKRWGGSVGDGDYPLSL